MRFRLSLFLAVFFAAQLAAETRLVLKNGDFLTGNVSRVEDGVIHFESDVLGHLLIPATDAVIEGTDASAQEATVESADPQVAEATPTPQNPEPATQSTDESTDRLHPPPPPWKKNIEFGMTLQSGRKDKMDVSGRFTAQRNIREDQYRLYARRLYGETKSEKSTDLFDSSFRWRRDMSPRVFTQALTAYSFDQIKDIHHDFSQGVGVGRKIYNLDTLSVSMGGGATARYRDENGDPPVWNYMVDAFQDMDYAINDVFKVTQDASILIEPEDPDNYTLRLNAALIGKISQTVSLSMRYEYEFDNSLSVENRLSQRIITSLGYLF
ncbi:MAG: DUF481 domain-containing protein [Opitutaceae bacterium]